MKMWGGRFKGEMDARAWQMNASISFDQRLAEQDVRGSLVWAGALKAAGVLSEEEHSQIQAGLEAIQKEFQAGRFELKAQDEDIHTAVERRLGELCGAAAGKLHTGRSRNDQVATDLRLWLLDHLPLLDQALADFQAALVERAEVDFGILMPGYTHLQRAQPVLLSHWWLSYFWPIQRDRRRLRDLSRRTANLPLGSGALAGTPFPIDREALAKELGFDEAAQNSIDGVSDRDFAAEFTFCCALCGVHLSRLAESMVLFSSAEFGFFQLSEAFSSGSSLMPQKVNPDVFELARGRAGRLVGILSGLLATLKGLPSAYDKDLQEDKLPVFQSFDLLTQSLPVLGEALRTLAVHPQKLQANLETGMMAADAADYLVDKGVPFREAHRIIGQAVRLATSKGVQVGQLSLEDLRSIDSVFEQGIYAAFDPQRSVERRRAKGGTAPEAVREQMELCKKVIEETL
jgi:argininosuccinate lyase